MLAVEHFLRQSDMGQTLSQPPPPFSLTAPRYDQSTFLGRVRHFQEVTDPRSLLVSDDELANALNLLELYKKGACDSEPVQLNEKLFQLLVYLYGHDLLNSNSLRAAGCCGCWQHALRGRAATSAVDDDPMKIYG